MRKTIARAAVLCAGSLALAACGESTETETAADNTTAADSADPADSTASEAATASANSALELVDGYCRAKPAADGEAALEHATELDEKHSDMTACFGTLKNTSDKEIAVRSFAVPSLEGASTELHEVVDGIMREKPDGFTIAAGDTYELVPGGDHLMIMNYADAIPASEIFEVEITTDYGSVLSLQIPVHEQPSGEENYGGDREGHNH